VPVCGGLFDLAPSSITLSEIEALLATDSTGDGVRILRDEIRGRDGDGESPAAVEWPGFMISCWALSGFRGDGAERSGRDDG
jgi:hypothetical protein